MTENQIQQLIIHGKFPDNQVCQELKQTHISWVILCKDYVYKIKKPVNLTFLDFSTLEKRKYFCEQELTLNQRLTSDLYLDVYPILLDHETYFLGPGTGKIVDYSVVMRRLDNSKEMSKLLLKRKVRKADMKKIAKQLAYFHQTTEIIKGKLTPELLIEDFNDIQQIQSFITNNIDKAASMQLSEIISFVTYFINENAALILKRDREGFTRDCHGDLHSGNIFLLDHPVVFDCIEFNKHFRQIDILSELAFFCMDLEIFQRNDLSKCFLNYYTKEFQVIRNKNEERLFLFYKLYRANVKAKINAIKTQQASDPEEKELRLGLFMKYFQLFLHYYQLLEKGTDEKIRASA